MCSVCGRNGHTPYYLEFNHAQSIDYRAVSGNLPVATHRITSLPRMSLSKSLRALPADEVVDRFERTLDALMQGKLPVSKSKIHAAARIALSHSHLHWHFVHRLEGLARECAPAYKLPTLYIIDSIVRHSRRHYDTDVFSNDFEVSLNSIFHHIFTTCPKEDRHRVIKMLEFWRRKKVFREEVLAPLFQMDQSRGTGPRTPPSPHFSSPFSNASGDSPINDSVSNKKILAKMAHSWNLLQSCEAQLNTAHANLEDLYKRSTKLVASPMSNKRVASPASNKRVETPGSNRRISSPVSNKRTSSPGSNRRIASPGSNKRIASPESNKRVASPTSDEPEPKRLCTSMPILQPHAEALSSTDNRQATMPLARVDHTTVCSTSLFVGRIGALWPDQSFEAITYNLRILFEEFGFGIVLGVDPIPGRYAFVHLSDRSDAVRAIKKLQQLATLVGSPLIFDWGWVRALRNRKLELQNYWDPEQGVLYIPHSLLTRDDIEWLNSEDTWVDFDTIPKELKCRVERQRVTEPPSEVKDNCKARPRMTAKVMYSRSGQPILGLNLPTMLVPLQLAPAPQSL